MEYEVGPGDGLIVAILILFLGQNLTKKVSWLREFNIPAPVTGGLICSTIVGLIYWSGGPQITFDMTVRDNLLLAFFATIGLSAKFSVLTEGGKALAILVIVSAVFLVVQDVTGVLLVSLMGHHPGYGLFGGSISFAGGYGTAIAWGDLAAEAGLTHAREVGIACATFGLIAGGMIGGPIAKRLIRTHDLDVTDSPPGEQSARDSDHARQNNGPVLRVNSVLGTLLAIAVCFELGDLVNRYLFSKGVLVPGFLTAMLCGILLTNLADFFQWPLNSGAISLTNDVSLQVFLSLSLISIQLWTLAAAIGPILLILLAQVTVMTVFAIFVVFRTMGRDYDACVIAAGFAGLGLGATPVAMANMGAITEKYRPSPKAFLVVPLVGAFFIDVLNALVIKFFITLPIISG